MNAEWKTQDGDAEEERGFLGLYKEPNWAVKNTQCQQVMGDCRLYNLWEIVQSAEWGNENHVMSTMVACNKFHGRAQNFFREISPAFLSAQLALMVNRETAQNVLYVAWECLKSGYLGLKVTFFGIFENSKIFKKPKGGPFGLKWVKNFFLSYRACDSSFDSSLRAESNGTTFSQFG